MNTYNPIFTNRSIFTAKIWIENMCIQIPKNCFWCMKR